MSTYFLIVSSNLSKYTILWRRFCARIQLVILLFSITIIIYPIYIQNESKVQKRFALSGLSPKCSVVTVDPARRWFLPVPAGDGEVPELPRCAGTQVARLAQKRNPSKAALATAFEGFCFYIELYIFFAVNHPNHGVSA